MTLHTRIVSLVAAAALLALAAPTHAAELKGAPKRRGPLKPNDMRRLAKQLNEGIVKEMRAEGKRAHAALSSGGTYVSEKYELTPGAFGDYKFHYLVQKGKGITEAKLGGNDHALVAPDGTVHVQVHVERQESGKKGPSMLSIRFNEGSSIEAPPGEHGMLISETRTSAANGKTPNARTTHRMYWGTNWDSTHVGEDDGWNKRNGKDVRRGLDHDTTYQPGGRAGVWDSPNRTFKPVAGKAPIQ
jgi:hypothetical protein